MNKDLGEKAEPLEGRASDKNVDINANGGAVGYHKDGSDYTLDISLNRSFVGGGLNFVMKDDKVLNKPHSFGRLVLFDGDITHCVDSIDQGERVQLVVFCNFL